MEFLTTNEISHIWNISARRVAILCEDGRLTGAVKKGKTWLIPSNTKKPNDGRYKKIVFTEKAEQIEAVLKSEIEESETILLQGVTKEERQEFLRIAEKMLQNLDTFPVNTVKKNAGRKKQQGGRTDE